jgi:hypothetical protein
MTPDIYRVGLTASNVDIFDRESTYSGFCQHRLRSVITQSEIVLTRKQVASGSRSTLPN